MGEKRGHPKLGPDRAPTPPMEVPGIRPEMTYYRLEATAVHPEGEPEMSGVMWRLIASDVQRFLEKKLWDVYDCDVKVDVIVDGKTLPSDREKHEQDQEAAP